MYITQALHRAAQQYPDRVAVRFRDRQRTFRQFADRVARLAGALQALGMRPGDRVAMLALNSDRYLEYQMAVPWGGGVLNPCNTRWSAAEIAYALEDSGSTILLVDDAFADMAAQLRRESTCVREVVHCGEDPRQPGMHAYEELLERAAPVPDLLRRGDDLAAILYTGGTTGSPKGVMLSHANLVNSALALCCDELVVDAGTYLHVAPMFHSADMGFALAQWQGASTHAILAGFEPERVLDALARERVTHVLLVPTMIQMLVDHPSMRKPRDLGALRTIIYGSSPISEALIERVMDILPGVGFVQGYGMTELAPIATLNGAFYHSAAGRAHGKLASAGRAARCMEVRIVDADDREVPRGTLGEIVARGPNVMLGYWNKPEQTAAAVRDGWMHTGDAAWMDDDGFIFIADRLKDMIVSGGENVYSSEVENALARHPSVAACAVIGIPDERWGETVHAVIVAKPGSDVAGDELIAHCRTLIAGYKCPRSVAFVDQLPLSGAGKVLKAVLREPFWRGRARRVA
ncbi:acyl-CoA synthetase [Scleromatobacter humisilvae]|uniref:Long-chain fatty acid--CoA ligase n=1 Tax=Scleromatobacter humisilvae TaxID=2897159 RepID=A0A9X2C0N4_9BURK|nr:long-chain fatty acid--CoA ligase [Scleromatobacter humisilvae]MCK9687497.1 long-chain fatty acid--CoA ligase [Scleromatobacter humisilvae]